LGEIFLPDAMILREEIAVIHSCEGFKNEKRSPYQIVKIVAETWVSFRMEVRAYWTYRYHL